MTRGKKIGIGILLGLIVIALSFFFYVSGGRLIIGEYIKRDNNENLSFSFSRCSDDSGGRNEVLSSEWLTNEKILVKGIANPNCGTTWLFGDYRVKGNSLTLVYSPVSVFALACVCSYQVEYEVSGLEKKDYEIRLSEENEIHEEPTFLYWLMGVYDE